MSGHYPFDSNGNLLPGLTVVNGQIIAASGQVVPEANAAAEQPAVKHLAAEPAFVPEDSPEVNDTILSTHDANAAADEAAGDADTL